MIRPVAGAASFAVLAAVASSAAQAQWSPPSYQADPAVCKLIHEDARFRVIVATWKPGQGDKPYAHPVPSVVYSLTSCTLRTRDVGAVYQLACRAQYRSGDRFVENKW